MMFCPSLPPPALAFVACRCYRKTDFSIHACGLLRSLATYLLQIREIRTRHSFLAHRVFLQSINFPHSHVPTYLHVEL